MPVPGTGERVAGEVGQVGAQGQTVVVAGLPAAALIRVRVDLDPGARTEVGLVAGVEVDGHLGASGSLVVDPHRRGADGPRVQCLGEIDPERFIRADESPVGREGFCKDQGEPGQTERDSPARPG